MNHHMFLFFLLYFLTLLWALCWPHPGPAQLFVRIWPQFGKELTPVSSKWRLFCLVTSQHLLRLGAWRIIHHI